MPVFRCIKCSSSAGDEVLIGNPSPAELLMAKGLMKICANICIAFCAKEDYIKRYIAAKEQAVRHKLDKFAVIMV